jgi:hypothetical protein
LAQRSGRREVPEKRGFGKLSKVAVGVEYGYLI